MIERYSRPGMRDIWSERRKLELWLEIELLALESLVQQGTVPDADFQLIKERAAFSVERCRELEGKVHHDVLAFTLNVAESIGSPASRWFHFGLTSSDVVDTAFAVQMREATDVLLEGLKALRKVIARKALDHQFTPMMGRSHGVHAEPITFGLKLAVMFDEFSRALTRLITMRRRVAVGKLTGAVGTNAYLPTETEGFVCERLGLSPAKVATQVIQRDIHADFISCLALIGCSVERWATEFRHLQMTEVLEVEEFFSKGQKGSSAMPHKRNPITGERLCGLSRVLRGNATAAYENVALWHERDISHSSVERVIFPDSCMLLDYMLDKLRQLTAGLTVHKGNMARNMKKSLGLWSSQAVLLELIRQGLSREQGYELVQRNAMKTWQAKNDGDVGDGFREQLLSDPEVRKYLDQERLDELCDPEFHFRHVRERFRRVGIE
ncbi:MAG: Adenylosuccinate lyase [Verrucomicrobia subdivision 3 bacterium]|nr:Adenylosuccinate lyase [Limisphaerales bacterium]MCS1412967.1 Adenylosuccinate lyase [Limisphaerales bacterium]